MPEDFQNIGEEYQRLSKEGFDATVRSFAAVNKGLRALTAEMTDYSKKAIDDGVRTWEQLLGVISLEQVIQIQSDYAKRAYEDHMAELSKLGEMCVSMTRDAYKPVEQAVTRKAS